MFYYGFHVFFVAISADLNHTCAKSRIHAFFTYYGHFTIHQRYSDFSTDVLPVSFILGINFHRHTCRYKFRAGSGNKEIFAAAFKLKPYIMKDAFLFYMIHFGIGYSGFVPWAPVNWVCTSIHETFPVKQNEAKLGTTPIIGVHGTILCGPINAAS